MGINIVDNGKWDHINKPLRIDMVDNENSVNRCDGFLTGLITTAELIDEVKKKLRSFLGELTLVDNENTCDEQESQVDLFAIDSADVKTFSYIINDGCGAIEDTALSVFLGKGEVGYGSGELEDRIARLFVNAAIEKVSTYVDNTIEAKLLADNDITKVQTPRPSTIESIKTVLEKIVLAAPADFSPFNYTVYCGATAYKELLLNYPDASTMPYGLWILPANFLDKDSIVLVKDCAIKVLVDDLADMFTIVKEEKKGKTYYSMRFKVLPTYIKNKIVITKYN